MTRLDNPKELAIFKKQLCLVDLEKELLKLPQVDAPVTHHFADGVYTREMFIPRDSLIIGKRHRHETCNILLQGELSLYMGPDIPVKRIKAPCIFNSKPGAKKMAYIHEDAIFLNIHPTNERDLQKIEEEFIIPEEEFIQQQSINNASEGDQKCLGQQ